jgi:acyl carrier protein
MDDTRQRLAMCFTAVFPTLSQGAIETAAPDIVEAWDSVATVTLMSVIEEEFHIQIEPDDIEQLLSFGKAQAYLESRLGDGGDDLN